MSSKKGKASSQKSGSPEISGFALDLACFCLLIADGFLALALGLRWARSDLATLGIIFCSLLFLALQLLRLLKLPRSSDADAKLRNRLAARRALFRVAALLTAAVVTYFSIELAQGALGEDEAAPWITLFGMMTIAILFLGEWPFVSAWIDRKLGPQDGVPWPDEQPIETTWCIGNALPVPGQMPMRVFLFAGGFGFTGGGSLRRAYVPFEHVVEFLPGGFPITIGAGKWPTLVYARSDRTRRVGMPQKLLDALEQEWLAWKRKSGERSP